MSNSVLQLNGLWQAMDYRTVEYALIKLFNTAHEEPLQPVHVELDEEGNLGAGTHVLTIQEWMEQPLNEAYPSIGMTRDPKTNRERRMNIPLVIITPSYRRIPKVQFQLNKRGLYIRDKGHCAYCSLKLLMDESTIDHVIPRAQGGKHTWENTVLSCAPCNNKKDSMTPKQAGMPLLARPHRPLNRVMTPADQGKVMPEHKAFIQ